MRLDKYLELVSLVTVNRLLEIETGIKGNKRSQKSFLEYIFRKSVHQKQQEGSFNDHYIWLIRQAYNWYWEKGARHAGE